MTQAVVRAAAVHGNLDALSGLFALCPPLQEVEGSIPPTGLTRLV